MIGKGDFAGASAILEKVVATDPGNKLAWRYLGFSYIKLKKYPEARAAYAKLLALVPDAPQALYNTAVVLRARGRRGRRVRVARQGEGHREDRHDADRRSTTTSCRSPPTRVSRRSCRRREDFANPFVEPRTSGSSASGTARRPTTSSAGSRGPRRRRRRRRPRHRHLRADEGRRRQGRRPRLRLLDEDRQAPVDSRRQPGDQLGIGRRSARATRTRTACPTSIASAPGGGYGYIYSGKDGRVLLTLTAEAKTDTFGRHVAGAGDVNHDGYDDVLVGAPVERRRRQGRGPRVRLLGQGRPQAADLDGRARGRQLRQRPSPATPAARSRSSSSARPPPGPTRPGASTSTTASSTKPRFVLESDDTGTAFGDMFMSVPGDLDGDGIPDVYASDFANKAKGPSTGRAYVFSGKTGKTAAHLHRRNGGRRIRHRSRPGGRRRRRRPGRPRRRRLAVRRRGRRPADGRTSTRARTASCSRPTPAASPATRSASTPSAWATPTATGRSTSSITSAWSGIKGNHSGRILLISSGVARPAK